MRTPSPVHLRTLLSIFGIAAVFSVPGCLDQRPLDPSATRALFTSDVDPSVYLSARGNATIDGTLARGEWTAEPRTFVGRVPGGGTANVRLYVMNNDTHLFLAVEYDRPISDPNNVVRFRFRQGSLTDELVFSSGSPSDHFLNAGGASVLDTSAGGTSDVTGVRRNSGGRTVYEISKKLNAGNTDPRDVVFSQDLPVEFQLLLIPGGNAVPTPFPDSDRWGLIEAAQYNDPAIPDIEVIVTAQSRCDVSVTARNLAATEAGFLLRRAVATGTPGRCVARFIDLPVFPSSDPADPDRGRKWILTARNTIIRNRAHFLVWPNPGIVEVDEFLPNQQGAVFIDEPHPQGRSEALNEESYYLAIEKARPLTSNRAITLNLQPTARRASCRNAPQGSFVHAMGAFNPSHPKFGSLPPRSAGSDPSALGQYVTASANGRCDLWVPNTHVMVEARASDGTTRSGLLGVGEAEVDLNPDPLLASTWYVIDGWNDATPLDIGKLVFGLVKVAGVTTNTFAIKADVRGLDQNNVATYQFELVLNPVSSPQSVRVTVQCSGSTGACLHTEIQPSNQQWRFDGMIGSVSVSPASPGHGTVTLRLDFMGVEVADLRLRTLSPGSGHDFAPNDVPGSQFARWDRNVPGGNSFGVSF